MALKCLALAEGYDVVIAARDTGRFKPEDLGGARLVGMPFARGSLGLGSLQREARSVRALMRQERPDIMHGIALKPIALMLLAGRGEAGRVFAVTGRGYLAVARAPWTRFAAACLAFLLRRGLAHQRSVLMVENTTDRAWAENGRALPDARVVLMPGAGVELEKFTAGPEPAGPIRIGIASRLIWSKGVDVAVDAVTRLRERGMAVELHIAGAPDSDNPEHVSGAEIERWRAAPGVRLLGRVADVNAFWADMHIACLPSRGGEGLPRSLLEAAACGRPIVTTATPGCADFAGQDDIGILVPPGDVGALADALERVAESRDLRQRMGAAARRRVEAGYTVQHASDCASRAWKSALHNGSDS